jgi:hypothetical protein
VREAKAMQGKNKMMEMTMKHDKTVVSEAYRAASKYKQQSTV